MTLSWLNNLCACPLVLWLHRVIKYFWLFKLLKSNSSSLCVSHKWLASIQSLMSIIISWTVSEDSTSWLCTKVGSSTCQQSLSTYAFGGVPSLCVANIMVVRIENEISVLSFNPSRVYYIYFALPLLGKVWTYFSSLQTMGKIALVSKQPRITEFKFVGQLPCKTY